MSLCTGLNTQVRFLTVAMAYVGPNRRH